MRGKCQGRDGEFVFRVAKESTVPDKKLKEFITQAAGVTIKPRFEVVADASLKATKAAKAKRKKLVPARPRPRPRPLHPPRQAMRPLSQRG